MPGKTWATKEQTAFLVERVPQYEEARATKKLSLYWPRLYREWFEKYPEKDSLFPGCDTLTEAQDIALRDAIVYRQQVSRC
jgi:hypothetical protein